MMSPQDQSNAMWIVAFAVNTAGICAGIFWGWEAFVQFLIPALGTVAGASLVTYSLRR